MKIVTLYKSIWCALIMFSSVSCIGSDKGVTAISSRAALLYIAAGAVTVTGIYAMILTLLLWSKDKALIHDGNIMIQTLKQQITDLNSSLKECKADCKRQKKENEALQAVCDAKEKKLQRRSQGLIEQRRDGVNFEQYYIATTVNKGNIVNDIATKHKAKLKPTFVDILKNDSVQVLCSKSGNQVYLLTPLGVSDKKLPDLKSSNDCRVHIGVAQAKNYTYNTLIFEKNNDDNM